MPDVSSIIQAAISLVTLGIVYGNLKSKIDFQEFNNRRFENELNSLKKEQKNYITMNHFDDSISQVRSAINEIRSDIKSIIKQS